MSAALALSRQAWISARVLWDAPFVVRFRGVLQALLATLLLVALVSWNPADASLNAASSLPTTNWLGANGALFADLFMQSLGLAAWPAALLLVGPIDVTLDGALVLRGVLGAVAEPVRAPCVVASSPARSIAAVSLQLLT